MEVGFKEEIIYLVQSSDLAKALSISEQDSFPEVFASSRMIALMELAAARMMKPILKKNELSVGVDINVTHIAATPNNVEVKSIATFTGVVGKLYKFEVELLDSGGRAGFGTHTRAIVNEHRLVSGALKKSQT